MATVNNSPNIAQVWSDVLDILRGQISPSNFESWFASLELQALEEARATVLVRDEFMEAWLVDNYLDLLEEDFANVVGRKISVDFVIEDDESSIIEDEEPHENNVIQLNLWKQSERAAPNPILRSALFGVVQRGRRRHCDNELLESWKNVDLVYSGKRLNQNDLDVWLQLVHLHRGGELGKPIPLVFRGVLRDIGRNTDGRSVQWLKDTIRRLNKGHIELSTDRYVYGGHLVHDYGWDEFTGDFMVTLNPQLSAFFYYDDFTRINWETRRRFRKGYTRWLHAFISSHHAPVDDPDKIRLEKLRELSGSTISRFRDFRAKVRKSMHELQEAGVVLAWRITDRDILKYVNTRD